MRFGVVWRPRRAMIEVAEEARRADRESICRTLSCSFETLVRAPTLQVK